MYRNTLSVASIVSALLLGVFINLTNPTSSGPAGILAVFVLIYVLSVGILTNVIYYGRIALKKLARYLSITIFKTTFDYKTSYYYGTTLGLAPVILIGLGSVGSFGIYEFLLVAVFETLGCFYVAKR